MAFIRVTMQNLRTTAEELRQMGRQLQAVIERLSESEQNLNNSWEGSASEAFHKAFLYDKDFMVMFYQLIEIYCAVMDQIADNYEQAENRNSDLAVRRNTGGGGGRYPSAAVSIHDGNMLSRLPSFAFTKLVYGGPRMMEMSEIFRLSDVTLKPFVSVSDMQ